MPAAIVAALFLTVSFGGRAADVPKLLIIQGPSQTLTPDAPADPKHPGQKLPPLKADPEVAEALAASLAAQGKVIPIVWDQVDPIFRTAYQSNKIPWISGPISMDQAQAGAKALDCKGIVFVYARSGRVQDRAGIYFRANLVLGSRQIWQFPSPNPTTGNLGPIKVKVFEPVKGSTADDPKYKTTYKSVTPKLSAEDKAALSMGDWMFMTESSGRKDDENAAIASIANTLAVSLGQGPFQDLEIRPAIPDEPVSPGLARVLAPILPAPVPSNDRALEAAVSKAEDDKSQSLAIMLAHQGVDQQPMNPRRRELLMKVLQKYGMTAEAVAEAQSAAIAFDNSPALLTQGADIACAAGQYDQALTLADKALTHDPSSVGARLVQAQVHLCQGDLAGAASALQGVSASSRDASWKVLSTLWEALSGNTTATAALVPADGPLPWTDRQSGLAGTLFEGDFSRIVGDFKTVLAKCVSAGSKDGLTDQLQGLIDRTSAQQQVLSHLPGTEAGNKSAVRRSLAYNLLLQSLEEVRQTLTPNGTGSLVDARMNLSEALRQMSLSKQPDSEASHGSSDHS